MLLIAMQAGLSLLWIIYAISVFCYAFLRVCLLIPCGHLLGKGWPLGSRLWCLIVSLSLSQVVSWVRCGHWLYWFLIFALLLTFTRLQTWRPRFIITVLIFSKFPSTLSFDISDPNILTIESQELPDFASKRWFIGESWKFSEILNIRNSNLKNLQNVYKIFTISSIKLLNVFR